MSLTLAQITTKVRTLTQESQTPAFATDANMLSFANDAILDIASRVKAKVISNLPNSTADPTDTTSDGVRLYSLPDGIMDVYLVQVMYWKCELAKEDDLYRHGGTTWWKIKGMPRYYYFEDEDGEKKLGLWPTPGQSFHLMIRGTKRPDLLTQTSDTPDLDERLHLAVVYKICQRMMESRREMERAAYWESQYEREISKYEHSGRDSNEATRFLEAAFPTD